MSIRNSAQQAVQTPVNIVSFTGVQAAVQGVIGFVQVRWEPLTTEELALLSPTILFVVAAVWLLSRPLWAWLQSRAQ